MGCQFWQDIYSIFLNLLAGYLLLVITKLYSLYKIRNFLGDYIELPTLNSDANYLKELKFQVVYKWQSLFTPVLHTSVIVTRKNVVKNDDTQDWTGEYHSDILNPYSFRGIYIIMQPGPNDFDGWHEMTLFRYTRDGKNTCRIALKVNYLDIRKRAWVSDGGYYIERV